MRHSLIILTVLSLLLLSSCAIFKINNTSQQENLQAETLLWQDFRIDGIIKITDQGFNLIKDIAIIRNDQQVKVTLYDTGFFGFSPQPFASLAITDSIYINIPSIDNPLQYEQINNLITGLLILKNGIFPQQELAKMLPEIMNTKKYQTADKILKFNKNLQLISFALPQQQVELHFLRENMSEPEKIELYFHKKIAVIIEVDKFTWKN
ncbi:MAG: hypothetical protein K9M99_03455 [Candidatus Cloacimonetes bacterium]|nr:hypothetical protein [Candidatus Cloacimonadota bacterium]